MAESDRSDEHQPGGAKPEPIPLEDAAEQAPAPAAHIPQPRGEFPDEPCPHCGAPMGRYDLVCIRCGYDLKSLKVARTNLGEVEVTERVAEAENGEPTAKPLVEPVATDPWLPLVLAGGSGLLLLIGYLAGAEALYPWHDPDSAEPVAFGERMAAAARLLVRLALLTGCGMAGLFLLAQMMQRTLGDLAAASLRMLGIVAVMRLVAFINVGSPRVEFWLEAVLQAAAFIGLAMPMYRISPRNAAILCLFSFMALIALLISAWAVRW